MRTDDNFTNTFDSANDSEHRAPQQQLDCKSGCRLSPEGSTRHEDAKHPRAGSGTAATRLLTICLAFLFMLSGLLVAGCLDGDDDDDDDDENGIELPDGDVPSWTINVSGLLDNFTISIADMIADRDSLFEQETTMVNRLGNEFNHTYIGIDIWNLLLDHNLKWNAGTVRFEATDGYDPDTSLYNVGLYYENLGIDDTTHAMLAIVEDGEWIAADNGGPVRVVMPEFQSKYWVGNLANITVEPWNFEVTGAVNSSREFSVDNLTVASDYNQTEFEVLGKGTEGETHATYSGVPLCEVLNQTAVWDNATKVLVKSVDDYEVLFNLSDIMNNPESDNPMILALKQDGNYMDMEDGLLQLIVPDDEYDDGDDSPDWFKNKWSKWISEIEILTDEQAGAAA